MCPSERWAPQVGECLRVCCSVGEATCPGCSSAKARLTAEVGEQRTAPSGRIHSEGHPQHAPSQGPSDARRALLRDRQQPPRRAGAPPRHHRRKKAFGSVRSCRATLGEVPASCRPCIDGAVIGKHIRENSLCETQMNKYCCLQRFDFPKLVTPSVTARWVHYKSGR